MLELKISQSSVLDATGKRIQLIDNTGNYDPTLNLSGYGTPNLNRSNIAVFPIGFLNSANGSTSPITFDPYDPLTSTTWNALATLDGWYSFLLVYVPVVQTPILSSYTEGALVFSGDQRTLLKVTKQADGTLAFTQGSPTDLLLTSSKTLDILFLPVLSFLKIALNQKKNDLLIDSENLSNTKKIAIIQNAYDTVRSIIQGSRYQFCIGNKYVAARDIQFLLTNDYGDL